MIKSDSENRQEINTETYLKKKKLKKENMEKLISQYVWKKETKIERTSKNLLRD